uniref:Uncharacterized protein n=1 Tax=Anguilla anguilla TaxID=7936 RepID=A0A0E9PMR0_ANGAN
MEQYGELCYEKQPKTLKAGMLTNRSQLKLSLLTSQAPRETFAMLAFFGKHSNGC